MSFSTYSGVLAAAVATSGTFSGSYPSGTRRGDFVNGVKHKLIVNGNRYTAPENFTIALGASTWTITWTGTNTLPAGASYWVELDMPGSNAPLVDANGVAVNNAVVAPVVLVDLGNPATAAATGIATAQLLGAAGNLTLDGATVSGGVAVLDVPRNVTLTVATTNQSGVTFTIYGTDEYGVSMVEQITGPNNNTVQGKKAFKRVTRVAASGAIATNGVSVGFGDVLGLPFHLPVTAMVLKEIEDSAAATSGTLVAGLSVLTKPTATNADVRGTYDPNSACDGTKSFQLYILSADPTYKGATQYTV